MYGIGWWYCCLNIADRTVIRNTCEGLVLTLGVGIPVEVWDAFWVATGKTNEFYRIQFRAVYGLTIATIMEDGWPMEVIRPMDDCPFDWGEFTLYVASPAAACLAGCGQSHFA